MAKRTLDDYYDRMFQHFGTTGWWPAGSEFEVAIGAILTQNTVWSNVEKAIVNLKAAKLMRPKRIVECEPSRLETALRPSGYFRVKAKRLRAFCEYLNARHRGSMKRLAKLPLPELRNELLALHGIGPETADDIILYACHKLVFVVDTYTRRILSRHGLVDPAIGYDDLRALFETRLDPQVDTFKEYHGLLVWTGNRFCRRTPRCGECPLGPTLKKGQPILE